MREAEVILSILFILSKLPISSFQTALNSLAFSLAPW